MPPLNKNVPNDYIDVLETTASGSHLRQGDVKRKGADLLVAPLKLNVRLFKCDPRSVGRLRRLVKRRNLHPLRDFVDEVVGLFPAQARVGDRLAKDAAVDRLIAVLQVGLDHKALD